MRRFSIALSVVGIAAVVFACSDDDHPHGNGGHTSNEFPACKEISGACHDLDTGSGLPHDCHVLAHDAKDEATCTAKKAECLAGCAKTDAGTTDSGSATDASSD